jgi:hypothetical protein
MFVPFKISCPFITGKVMRGDPLNVILDPISMGKVSPVSSEYSKLAIRIKSPGIAAAAASDIV